MQLNRFLPFVVEAFSITCPHFQNTLSTTSPAQTFPIISLALINFKTRPIAIKIFIQSLETENCILFVDEKFEYISPISSPQLSFSSKNYHPSTTSPLAIILSLKMRNTGWLSHLFLFLFRSLHAFQSKRIFLAPV